MRIGMIPALKPQDGGIYQYSVSMLRELDEVLRHGSEDDFVVFAHDAANAALRALTSPHWIVRGFRPPEDCGPDPQRERRLAELPHPEHPRFQADLHEWFTRCGVELMIYPFSHRLSFETRFPYVFAIHDLQHRINPRFPEVSADGEWQRREYLFRNAARYATLLIAGSEVGREEIIECYGPYGVEPDRIKVLPFLPCHGSTVGDASAERRGLPSSYLFYPAQFWPHKNHMRIVQALALLKQQAGAAIPIVFAGGHGGSIRENHWGEVMALIQRLGLQEQVHDLGYVADEGMGALFRGATALVMPTFFGPTVSIPVLEAWALGCPVLTSDARGIREQAGDAAVLVDPASVESIADGIWRLWTDETLREAMKRRGAARLRLHRREDYREQLQSILDEAKDRARIEGPRRPPIGDRQEHRYVHRREHAGPRSRPPAEVEAGHA